MKTITHPTTEQKQCEPYPDKLDPEILRESMSESMRRHDAVVRIAALKDVRERITAFYKGCPGKYAPGASSCIDIVLDMIEEADNA